MIVGPLLVAVVALALFGWDRRGRRRRALLLVGRLGELGTLALPGPADELRAPCGHLAAVGCGCARPRRAPPPPTSLPSDGIARLG